MKAWLAQKGIELGLMDIFAAPVLKDQQDDNMSLIFNYNASTLSLDVIKLLSKNILSVLRQICENPKLKLGEIVTDKSAAFDMLKQNVRQRILAAASKLKDSIFFAQIPDGYMIDLAKKVKVNACATDDIICKGGARPENLVLIADGYASYSLQDAEGWMHPVKILTEGDIAAVEAILDGEKCAGETTAVSENVDVISIPAEAMKELMRSFPSTALEIIKMQNERITQTTRLWMDADA